MIKISDGPHIKSSDHTSKIMFHLLVALFPIIIFAFYKNGIVPYVNGYTDIFGALKPLLLVVTGVISSFVFEGLYARFILKDKKYISYIFNSYALFPGLFLALVLPVNVSFGMVIIGTFFANIIAKLLFGGFGKNIFNPALVGVLIVLVCFGSTINANGGYLNSLEIDTISSATPLTNLVNNNYKLVGDELVEDYGGINNFLLGNIPGALGETCKLLILCSLAYLIAMKVIKWRIPIFYLLTFIGMQLIISMYNGFGLSYVIFSTLSGGLLFGATFMATDPVTSPVTNGGQIIYGIGLGILTIIFRFLTPYPEGVLTAILTMNLLVFIIDKIGYKIKFRIIKPIYILVVLLFIIISLGLLIGNSVKHADESKTTCEITNVKTENNKIIYYVQDKGFKSIIKTEIIFENSRITKINVLEQGESYWNEIINQNYIDNLINNQETIEQIDTISGVTFSSRALRNIVKCSLDDYEVKYER